MIFIPFVYIFSFFLGSVVVRQEVVMDTNIYTFLIHRYLSFSSPFYIHFTFHKPILLIVMLQVGYILRAE